MREQHEAAIRDAIPKMYSLLVEALAQSDCGPIAVFHDTGSAERYGVRLLGAAIGEENPLSAAVAGELTSLLRGTFRPYRRQRLQYPNLVIAFDAAHGHAWYGKAVAGVRRRPLHMRLDAKTLEPIRQVAQEGLPPRLAERGQVFLPGHVPALRASISVGGDRPEEAFLIEDALLRLAVDSLEGADVLDPLPVHLNALWVFARPVIMLRPDLSERHVRAIWFRDGEVMWRMRTYAAGVRGAKGLQVKEVGRQVAGRRPFLAEWDDHRPEQKLLPAIWSLMAQGGITETEPLNETMRDARSRRDEDGLTLVRVKAGTDHAAVYGSGASHPSPHISWSVRGHWRHQPYPSLGRDENGKVRTRPIWIASYTKGAGVLKAGEKVIRVTA